MDVARVHVRSWQAAYRGLLPDEYLDSLRPEDRAQHYDFAMIDPSKPHTVVAIEGGLIVGFASMARSRDQSLPDFGELLALYVEPTRWGRGFGVALVSAARSRLVEDGFSNAMLWVLSGNERADRFYRVDGWVPDGERKADVVWGVHVDEVRYQRQL